MTVKKAIKINAFLQLYVVPKNTLDTKNIKLMWINYPHMPTGADFSEKKLNELISWAYKNDIILINDNNSHLLNLCIFKMPINLKNPKR